MEDADATKKKQLLLGKKILCRICKGDHFTTKCPYKDTLQPLEELNSVLQETTKEARKLFFFIRSGNMYSTFLPF